MARYNKRVDTAAKGLLGALDGLSRTPCPTCGGRTLEIHARTHSGIRIWCTGFNSDAEKPSENEEDCCPYVQVFLFTPEGDMPKVVADNKDAVMD